MIVGGQSSEKSEDKTYALSLDPQVEVPSCLRNMCDFPRYFEGASAGIFEDGLPTVCGGRTRGSPQVYHKDCFKFNFTNAWEYSGSKSFFTSHTGKRL